MPSYRYLLDLDSDLAEELEMPLRLAARPAATVVMFAVDAGDIGLGDWLSATHPGPGVLVIDGLLVAEIQVGGRTAAELVGPGDLLQPISLELDELVGCDCSWRALVRTRLALLDGAFADRVQPWPQISRALLRRAGRRTRALNVHRAICAQPRLELRLTLLLWHLAPRWGRVQPGGIRLTVPLTHQLLGRLVGAERPSVSHALSRLSHAGLVTGHGDEWLLHGTLDEHLATLTEPERADVRSLVSEISRRRG